MAKAEKFSEGYRRMSPEQLNSELHSIFDFVPGAYGSIEHDRARIDVVDPADAEKRQTGKIYKTLNQKLTSLLDLVTATPDFKKGVLRFLWMHYVVLREIEESDRGYSNLLLQNNIFVPQKAKLVERAWYYKELEGVNWAIDYIVRCGLSTEHEQRWRIEGMEEWRQRFVECHGEEP